MHSRACHPMPSLRFRYSTYMTISLVWSILLHNLFRNQTKQRRNKSLITIQLSSVHPSMSVPAQLLIHFTSVTSFPSSFCLQHNPPTRRDSRHPARNARLLSFPSAVSTQDLHASSIIDSVFPISWDGDNTPYQVVGPLPLYLSIHLSIAQERNQDRNPHPHLSCLTTSPHLDKNTCLQLRQTLTSTHPCNHYLELCVYLVCLIRARVSLELYCRSRGISERWQLTRLANLGYVLMMYGVRTVGLPCDVHFAG